MSPRMPLWQVSALPLAILAGCAGSEPPLHDPHEMAETALLGGAMALRRCMKENDNLPERCRAERRVYEDQLTAFKATYGDGR